MIEQYRQRLAQGHTETWLATVITLWALAVVIFSWYLTTKKADWVKYALAGIVLYEMLP